MKHTIVPEITIDIKNTMEEYLYQQDRRVNANANS